VKKRSRCPAARCTQPRGQRASDGASAAPGGRHHRPLLARWGQIFGRTGGTDHGVRKCSVARHPVERNRLRSGGLGPARPTSSSRSSPAWESGNSHPATSRITSDRQPAAQVRSACRSRSRSSRPPRPIATAVQFDSADVHAARCARARSSRARGAGDTCGPARAGLCTGRGPGLDVAYVADAATELVPAAERPQAIALGAVNRNLARAATQRCGARARRRGDPGGRALCRG
jgi:hypothetical protein